MKTTTTATSRWLQTGVFLASLWAVLIIGLTAKTILFHPSFEAATNQPCPQLLLPLAPAVELKLQSIDARLFFKVVIWRDAKTRTEVSPFRQGEQALSCAQLEQRAQLFLLGAKSGLVKPRVHLRKSMLATVIAVPALALFALAFLLHLLSLPRRPVDGGHSRGKRAT